MKNQYFGDINDYRKYGLLRALTSATSLRTLVCWMLTPDDGSKDGRKLQYLDQPEKHRIKDPDLFDELRQLVKVERQRDVFTIQGSAALPFSRFSFFDEILGDSKPEREAYFRKALAQARGCELIFFDPDNGFEIKSKPYPKDKGKDTSKYLYWRELEQAYQQGHSLVAYQHFGRQRRNVFTPEKAEEIKAHTGCEGVWSFRTANVVFFLAPQAGYRAKLKPGVHGMELCWGKDVRIGEH